MAITGFAMEGIEVAGNTAKIAIHDEKEETGTLANMLASLTFPESPVPLGVFRDVDRPVYHEMMHAQIEDAKKAGGEADLNKLIRGGKTWTVS
jgi:2-oxoglutarate/2-oxoacid ferredoxin oxidoreductase subunit beta